MSRTYSSPLATGLCFIALAGMAGLTGPIATLSAHSAETSFLTLQKALEDAKKENPELRALATQAEAQALEADTQFYLPPPMLNIGSMGMEGPLSSEGHMRTSFWVTQDIPFPGKISGKREALRQSSLAARSSAEARWLDIQAQVRRSYLDYWRSRETQALLEEKLRVLEAHLQRLRAGSLQTQMMQAHLVAAGTDLEIARSELDSVRSQERQARGELNALMGKDAFNALPAPVEPALSPLPATPSSEELAQAEKTHPEVQESQRMLQAAEAEKSSARSEWIPDLSLSFRWNNNTPLALEPSNTELMVGVTLPFLYFWQPAAMNRAAAAKASAAEARLEARKNGFRLQLLKKHSEVASLRVQYLRYQDSVLKSAQKRLHIAHGIAPTDIESLTEHRESTEKAVELKIKALELRVDYEKAVAEYQQALGKTL